MDLQDADSSERVLEEMPPVETGRYVAVTPRFS
jgi:hypothetical protein